MTITIHLLSLLLGFFLGTVLVTSIMLWVFFDERWSIGFTNGWECGKKYAEELEEKGNDKAIQS